MIAEESGELFSKEQYALLKKCSKAGDTTEWNKWRADNPAEPILLQGAKLNKAHLEKADLFGANLRGARLRRANLNSALLNNADLSGADLRDAKIKETVLHGACLEHANCRSLQAQGACMEQSVLRGADLFSADLKGAKLRAARMEGAVLDGANLSEADLREAVLDGALLDEANLVSADISDASLKGTVVQGANLSGVRSRCSVVDGGTMIWGCAMDDETDFTGVGLHSARIEPGIKSRLEGNIRRFMWKQWYTEHPAARYPVAIFWAISDYGRSTARVLETFFVCTVIFAAVYAVAPGLVANLHAVDGVRVSPCLLPIRAIYFSIVTMTTLGFGDMYAAPGSAIGQILLMIQVMTGYALLGALVTRLAILFQET